MTSFSSLTDPDPVSTPYMAMFMHPIYKLRPPHSVLPDQYSKQVCQWGGRSTAIPSPPSENPHRANKHTLKPKHKAEQETALHVGWGNDILSIWLTTSGKILPLKVLLARQASIPGQRAPNISLDKKALLASKAMHCLDTAVVDSTTPKCSLLRLSLG